MKNTKVMYWGMLVLLILSCFSTVAIFLGDTAAAEADITNKVTISGFEMQSGDGQPITEDNPIKLGDVIRIKYLWGVSRENMEGINAGDSFTVTLPDPEYFGGYSDAGPYALENPSGGPSLGTYELKGTNFIVTINEEGARQTELVNGWLSAHVRALKKGNGIDGGGNGSEAVPKLEIIDPGGGGGTTEDDEEFKDYDLPFYKTGKQIANTNSINWAFRVNYAGIKHMIDTYSINGPGVKMSARENVLLIDRLAPGMKFQADSIFVTVPIFIINSNGKMGTRVVKGTNNLQIQDSFLRIDPLPGEDYETFKERVRKYPSQTGDKAYGIYLDNENRETVLIAFGSLPSSSYSYNDIHGGEVARAIQQDTSLSEDQRDKMLDIYCDPTNSPSDTGVVAYDISFNVDVQVQEGYGEGKYLNQAELIWDDNESESWETETDFFDIGGLVQGEMIQADKLVEGTGVITPPRTFEFEIVDELAPQLPVAYGTTTQPIAEKGKPVEVKFYRTKDADGTYQNEIIGNDAVSGWKSVFISGHSYYLQEVTGAGYNVSFTGGLGEEGNRFDYNEKINKVTHFVVTNTPSLGLNAQKKVTGTAELTESQVFTFELRDQQGQAVAYGRADINQKEKEFPIDFYTSPDFEAAAKIKNWQALLKDGEKYTLVEMNTNDYQPEYFYQNEEGKLVKGDTITADFESEKSINFLVENQKEQPESIEVGLKAYKRLEGRQLIAHEFEFELYDEVGNLLETQSNDENGEITFLSREFQDVGTHRYTIVEKLGAEPGMTYDSKKVTAVIEIAEDNGQLSSTVSYEDDDQKDNAPEQFINSYQNETPPTGNFLLEKIDIDSEEPLANAVFHLYDSNNQRVKEDEVIQTGPDGTVKVTNLPYGEYLIYEIDAPEGYQIEKDPEKVVINEENAQQENLVINRDPKIKQGITLTKIDSDTNKKLPGAEFILRDTFGKEIAIDNDLITDENGIIHIDHLPAGTYSLTEIKAPDNYLLDKNPLIFTVTEENNLVELTKKNKKIPELIQTVKNNPTAKAAPQSITTAAPATNTANKTYPASGSKSDWFWSIVGLCLVVGIWLWTKRKLDDHLIP